MAEFKSNLKDRLNDFISFKRSIGNALFKDLVDI